MPHQTRLRCAAPGAAARPHTVGFSGQSLRALITGLLGSDYRPGQMTYDLRRLRLAGLIARLPHSNRYGET